MSTTSDQALGTLLSQAAPQIAREDLAAALWHHWQLSGQLSPLTGERDLNFQLKTDAGSYLVKLANPAESRAMSEFQTLALLHVARQDPSLPVSRVILPEQGLWHELPQGRLRVYSWLEGQPMPGVPASDALAHDSGVMLARLAQALRDFSHPADDYRLLWDIKQAADLLPLLPAIADAQIRDEAAAFLPFFAAEIAPKLQDLPRQVCHNDLNRHNLLVDPQDHHRIAGILDFGDMVRTLRICDLAVAACYQIDPARPLARLSQMVEGYASVQPLLAREIALLFDLITARMVTSLAIGGWRAASHPENAEYILRNTPAAQAGLQAFRSLGRDEATQAFQAAADRGAQSPNRPSERTKA